MRDDVVDDEGARRRRPLELLPDLGVAGEEVEGQGLLALGHDRERVRVEGRVPQDRADGPEDLVGHEGRRLEGRRVRPVVDERRLDVPRRLVRRAAVHRRAGLARVGHERRDAVEGPVVDDAAVVRRLGRVRAVEGRDLRPERAQERVGDGRVDEQIVGPHAGLAAVREEAPADAARGDGDVAGLVDDARRLAAELERRRAEVLRRGLGDHPAHGLAAREEDVVPAGVQDGLRRAAVAADDARAPRVEPGAHELRDGRRRRGRVLVARQLEHDAVARGDGADHRGEAQEHGVVPRADDLRDDVPSFSGSKALEHLSGRRTPPMTSTTPRGSECT